MAKEKNVNDLIGMLNGLSKSICDLDNSISGKIIVEENRVIDSSLPIDLNRLSPDKKTALNEANYINARREGQVSKSHVDRLARDLIDAKSKGIIKVNIEE